MPTAATATTALPGSPDRPASRRVNDQRYMEMWRLSKDFPGPAGPVIVVEDFSLMVRRGEFICLIGHSGCGKSTVLSMVAGLATITRGAVVLDDREIDGPGPDRGVVFQSPCLLPWMTALENVRLGVAQTKPDATRAEQAAIARHYLELVGLGDAARKRPRELSQGMRQRVGIARAFALGPKVLLLDEPFGMLDCITRMELQDVLIELWGAERRTALMVTHDVDEALLLADRVVMMTNGPRAGVGEIVEVPFARPRDRASLLEHPDYYPLRERLIGFLEDQAKVHPSHGPHAVGQASLPVSPSALEDVGVESGGIGAAEEAEVESVSPQAIDPEAEEGPADGTHG